MTALSEAPSETVPDGAPKARRDGVGAETDQSREERWAIPAIVALTWSCVIVPSLVQTFTQPKYRVFTGATVEYGTAALVVSLATMMALFGLCGVVIVRYLGRLRGDRRGLLLAMLIPWVYQVCRDLYVGTSLRAGGLIYPLVTIALWVLRPRIRQLGTLGYLIGLTAVTSLLMGVFVPTKGLLSSVAGDLVTPDKQLLPWGILVGPLSDGNPLAQFLALGIPAMAFISRRWIRFPLMAVTAFCVLWASSRSALMAIGAACLIALILTATPRSARRFVSVASIFIAGAVVVILPVITTDPRGFTNRGYIWSASLHRWKDNPVVGLGSRWYSTSAEYTNSIGTTAFHGHNEAVQLMVLGGVLNLALVGFLFAVMAFNVGDWARRDVRSPAAFMIALLVSSALEVSYSLVHRSYLLPITLVPFAFFAFARENSVFAAEPEVEQSTPRRRRRQTRGATPDRAAPAARPVPRTAPISLGPVLPSSATAATTALSLPTLSRAWVERAPMPRPSTKGVVPPPTRPISLPSAPNKAPAEPDSGSREEDVHTPAPTSPESLLTRPIELPLPSPSVPEDAEDGEDGDPPANWPLPEWLLQPQADRGPHQGEGRGRRPWRRHGR